MRTRSGDSYLSIAEAWLLDSTTLSLTQRNNMPHRLYIDATAYYTSLICLFFFLILQCTPALAVPMQNDPNGFEGIPWGATFSESDTFVKVEDTGRSQTYELKAETPTLGTAKVDSMRFVTSEGKFADRKSVV